MELKLVALDLSDEAGMAFVRHLMEDAFPLEERPSWKVWDARIGSTPEFQVRLIQLGDQPVGFVTFWQTHECCYIEHFATSEALRGKGYGQSVMELMLGASDQPLLLEVELPQDEFSRRRIVFYERCGFHLLETDYSQPPYHEGMEWLPMRLMSDVKLDAEQTKRMVAELHRLVYRIGVIAD